jgi:ferrous iron transport protein A
MSQTLAVIKPGTRVQIKGISDSAIKPKLLEMGLITGTAIDVLFVAPFGDPIAIDVKGYVLSLRLDEAAMIDVEPVNEQQS